MKKLLFILSLITVQSFGQSTIVRTSFDSLSVKPIGDLSIDVLNWGAEFIGTLRIYDNFGKVKSQSYLGSFNKSSNYLGKNNDGSDRFVFQVTSNIEGNFSITFSFDGGDIIKKGIFNYNATTGLNDLDYSNSEQIKEVFYYNLNGVKIENPDNYEGVLIKRNVYFNSASSSIKILQSYKY